VTGGELSGARALRVLMLNHNISWRSTFFRAFYFGRELAALGHQVTLATISTDRFIRPRIRELDGVQLVETPDWGRGLARTGWDPWDAFWRVRHFSRQRFDLVHGFDCRPAVLVPSLAVARRRGIPWVSDWADCWGGEGGAASQRANWIGRIAFRPIETWLEEGFRHRAAAVTVTSRLLFERATGFGWPQVRYLPSGANVSDVTPRPRDRCRAALGLPQESRVACFVGFVQYDLELVIRAFAVARRRVTAAKLLLVGPTNARARALAADLGLDGEIHDVGARPFAEIPDLLGAADLLLLPMSDNLMNRARGPIKLGDYLAAGRATLANPVGDLVEVFGEDGVGVLAEATPEAYGQAIAELLADPAACAAMGRRARAVAESKYAWSRLAPRLIEVYEHALAADRGRRGE
jgi:glycosyltransferase involved in cell wall biosynthesis